MGTIKLYALTIPSVGVTQPVVTKSTVHGIPKGLPIIPDTVDITLAEYDPDTRNAITAHHLKDYRRKRFNLNLLPDVHTLFDDMLEGSDYWRELLHNEDAYY